MLPKLQLVVSIDTEEDNWRPVREGIALENLRELPRLHGFLRDLDLRPTYFVDHPVASTPWTLDLLRGIATQGGGEIGAHLHPWNTPPLREELTEANTMLRNLPFELQREKLETLRESLTAVSGRPPTSFRAGRFGLGRETVAALLATGFEVDSSVTPFVSWAAYGGGSDFDGAPVGCYRLDGCGDPRIPAPAGALREVPVSCGFTRRPFARVASWYRRLTSDPLRRIPLASLATRTGVVRRVIGSPETNSVKDLLAVGALPAGRRSGLPARLLAQPESGARTQSLRAQRPRPRAVLSEPRRSGGRPCADCDAAAGDGERMRRRALSCAPLADAIGWPQLQEIA